MSLKSNAFGIRRALNEAMISIGAVLLLLAILVAVDGRVREQVSLRFSPHGAQAQIEQAGSQVHDVLSVVFEAARDQSLEHAPMMIFVLAASVLVAFMLRT